MSVNKATNRDDSTSFLHKILPPSILAAMTTIFYYFSLRYPFQFDDIANITKNFEIRNFDPSKIIFKNRWLGEYISGYNYKMGKFNPLYYRSWNLLIHVVAGVLLFYLIYLICQQLKKDSFLYKNTLIISTVTAGLFLLHPVQTQAISYIVQARLEGLASLFVILCSLLLVLVSTAKSNISKYILSVLLLIAGFIACGTKEIAIMSPFLLISLDWFMLSDQKWSNFKKRLLVHIAFAVVIFGTFAWFQNAQWFKNILGLQMTSGNNRGNVLTEKATDLIKPYAYFISEFKVILHYLGVFLWPFNMSVEYDWKLSSSIFAPDSFFPLLALLAIGVFIIRNIIYKRYPVLTFGLVWFFIAISPRSSIVPSAELICDYKTYLASTGWLFAISIGLVYGFNFLVEKYRKSSGFLPITINSLMILTSLIYSGMAGYIFWNTSYHLKRFASLIFLVALAAIFITYYMIKNRNNNHLYTAKNKTILIFLVMIPLGYSTYNRNIVWSSGAEFWGDIVKKAPLKARGHNNYGVALSELGKVHEAIKAYKEAIRLDPIHYCDPHSNLAVAYSNVGKTNQAIAAIKDALRIYPNYPEAYNNLGAFLLKKKDYEGAERCFDVAINLRPWYGKAHLNKGRLYMEIKQNNQAWESFVNATKGDLDNNIGFTALGEAGVKLGKFKEASVAFEKAIQLGANDPRIIFNLANSYYMEKEYPKAVNAYNFLATKQPQNPHYVYNLGESLFAMKKYKEALNIFFKAKELNDSIPQTHLRIAACFEALGENHNAKRYLQMLQKANAPDWFKKNVNTELVRLEGAGTKKA